MKHDVQKIVDEVLDGNQITLKNLPELLEDPEFRQEYLKLMIEESLISHAVAMEASKRSLKGKSTKKPIAMTGVIALAAAIVLAFIFFYKPIDNNVAQIIEGNINYTEGKWLESNSLIEVPAENQLTLEYKDKSKITLKGPCKGELKENGFKLAEGFLSAKITKQDNKFEIQTPHSNITVVGTAFKVSTLANSTQIEVEEGKVLFSNETKTLQVNHGEFSISSKSLPFATYKINNTNLPDDILKKRLLHTMNKSTEKNKIYIYPIDDSTVRSGGFNQKKFGKYSVLTASKKDEIIQEKQEIFIKFDLSQFKHPVKSAKLKLNTVDSTDKPLCAIKLITEDTWNENSITGQNAPKPIGEDILTWQAEASKTVELDLTETVNREIANDKVISLYIYLKNNSYCTFPSRENQAEDLRPQLILEE